MKSTSYAPFFLSYWFITIIHTSVFLTDLLYALGSQSVQFTPKESVTLNINVASTPTDIHYNFRALTWFHDGVEVIPNERITIMDFNKTLTIFNATDDDSGVYEATFTGLFIHPYNEYCEQDILALLRYYPVAIPVHFYVYQNSPGKLTAIDYAELIHLAGTCLIGLR